MSARMEQLQKSANVQMSQLQKTIEVKDNQIALKQRANEALIDKLSLRRISVTDPILRQPDGYIQSLAAETDIVYINLGEGAHIVPGMTFEVYNQRDGIPKQDDLMSEDNLPVGEASIEVQNVLSNGAQCRVIKTEIGQHINAGDPIANLVYDRNTKYKFVVYGDFDLGQTGTARAGDRQKIEALVTRWGGQIQKEVTADTDFVVMGKVPEVHSFPAEELADDPIVKQQQEEEKATYDAYEKVLDSAKDLHIPFMNQNRFLYFCGYYDNAMR
jgi:NAD-dependent DNA ligase